jgi:ribosomal protein S18 acetylase RimI-like enzyme
MTLAPVEVVPCPPELRGVALGVLYRRAADAARPLLVAQALADATRGELDLSGLWVARRRGRVVGAMLTQPLAGRAAAVWAPEVPGGWGRGALAATIVGAALADLRARGFRVAQALVDPRLARPAAEDLRRGGLPRVTELIYLARSTLEPLPDPPAPRPEPPALHWRPFGPEAEAEFREVLASTYLGSLDMPELEGVRSLDDVLASHRASGRFDPGRWRLGRVPGEPPAAAILLLADQPERSAWEVAYLGLTPAARGRGLGRAALAHALDLARPHRERLELAVDARNTPALGLYRAAGFRAFDRRSVHLKVLDPPP